MTAQIKTFIKTFERLGHEKSPRDLFRDFCEMGYCAYAKLTAPNQERADAIEAQYMAVVNSYRDKDTIRAFPELLAIMTEGLHGGGCDFLGQAASQMETLSSHIGQFFTPFEICKLMAGLQLDGAAETIKANGYITVMEPASGAGAMILAVADVLAAQGFDPGRHMLAHCTDVAPMCFHMTYLQLATRGIPAQVVHGNSLSLETWATAWTPATMPFYAEHGRLFATKVVEPQQPAIPEPTRQDSTAGTLIAQVQLALF